MAGGWRLGAGRSGAAAAVLACLALAFAPTPGAAAAAHARHASAAAHRRHEPAGRRTGRPAARRGGRADGRRPAPAGQATGGYTVVGHLTVEATAYWPDPSWSDGVTSTGVRAQYGVVAVDPSVIPLGTHLYIPGYGQAVAADTGAAIVGDRIDVCFDTAWQAQDWGVRYVTVAIERPTG
ncbi:MAG: 3D domain-containing protein [Firmicutes bacterium]|nr:3D domain-containing protein [Bacillota bacterium]